MQHCRGLPPHSSRNVPLQLAVEQDGRFLQYLCKGISLLHRPCSQVTDTSLQAYDRAGICLFETLQKAQWWLLFQFRLFFKKNNSQIQRWNESRKLSVPARRVSNCLDPVVIHTSSDRRAWTSVALWNPRGIILRAIIPMKA